MLTILQPKSCANFWMRESGKIVEVSYRYSRYYHIKSSCPLRDYWVNNNTKFKHVPLQELVE